MRHAIVQLPDPATAAERRSAKRAAIRQLERAEVYLAAVAYMDLGDGHADQAIRRLRAGLGSLGRYLAAQVSGITE